MLTKLLNTPFGEIEFADVVTFCKELQPEGIQLDYKSIMPSAEHLKKLVCAFSNTRGGLIIIGVEEDKKSGAPIKYDGVPHDAKVIESLNQVVSNIQPIPSYDVGFTQANTDGLCFLLIRVTEGDKPPYYVFNDGKIWVRTGDINNPIGSAHPDAIELMYKKKDQAEYYRKTNIERTAEVCSAGMEKLERERLASVAKAKQKGEEPEPQLAFPVGSNASFLKIYFQPYYPKRDLMTTQALKATLPYDEFAGCFNAGRMQPMPQGLYKAAVHFGNGGFYFQAVKTNGMIALLEDVKFIDDKGPEIVHAAHIVRYLFACLKMGAKFSAAAGFSGLFHLQIYLDQVSNVFFQPMSQRDGWGLDGGPFLLPRYDWDYTVSVQNVATPEKQLETIKMVMKDVYWSCGFENAETLCHYIPSFDK